MDVGLSLRVCFSHLLRLQRLHRYCHRSGAHHGYSSAREFRRALSQTQSDSVLELLAHDADAMVPFLLFQSIHARLAFWQTSLAGLDRHSCDAGQYDGLDWSLAWRDSRICFVGTLAWIGALHSESLERIHA